MKKYFLIISIALVIGLASACTDKLAIPTNVKIDVTGRLMTVTWDAVSGAQGYEIYTTSSGCASGNRIINTKDNTATSHTGTNALFDDGRNGAVQIKGSTKIEITLMPEWNTPGDNTSGPNYDVVMASAVTAKVKALGVESDYSQVVTLNKADYK